MGIRKQTPAMMELVTRYEEMAEIGQVHLSDEASYRLLLAYYERQEMFERVLEVTEYAKEQFPYRAEWYTYACTALNALGLAEDVVQEAEQARMLGIQDAALCAQLVKAHIQLEQHDKALGVIARQKGFSPHPQQMAVLYYLEGLVWHSLGEYASAIEAFRNCLLLDTRHEDAYKYLWLTSELMQTQDLAVELFEHILDEDPYAARAWYCLANLCVAEGQYDKALEAYDFTIVCNERIADAYLEYAELLSQLNKHHQALRVYQDYIDHFGTTQEVLVGIARCYFALDHLSAARCFLESAIEAEPMDTCDELYYLLGECYAAEGFWHKARHFYIEAIKINSRHEAYALSMAEACYHLDQLKEAQHWYEAAIEMAPEDLRCWLRYVSFLLDSGQATRALEVIEEAELNTCGAPLLYGRVACLYALGRREEAQYLLREALEQDYSMHAVLFDLWPQVRDDSAFMQVIHAFQALPGGH